MRFSSFPASVEGGSYLTSSEMIDIKSDKLKDGSAESAIRAAAYQGRLKSSLSRY